MFKRVNITILSMMMVFLFVGCVPADLSPSGGTTKSSPKNSWAEDTNIDEADAPVDTIESKDVVDDNANIIKRIAFPTSEYTNLLKIGKGTVKGKIYITDAYDQGIIGKNSRLYLNPVTTYSKQWYKDSYIGGNKMGKADKRLFNYLKFTSSNSKGAFAFYGVPSGSYYLIGTVKCGEECGYDSVANIRVATEVTISGGEVIDRDLTKKIE